MVSYRGSWIAHHSRSSWAGDWTIECEKGAIAWSSRGEGGEQVRVFRGGDPEGKAVAVPKLRYTDRAGALEAFVKAVESKSVPETCAADNVHTLRLVHAAIVASHRRQAVRV